MRVPHIAPPISPPSEPMRCTSNTITFSQYSLLIQVFSLKEATPSIEIVGPKKLLSIAMSSSFSL